MIFIKNPLVFCSASSHERRIVPDEWWETWDEYNGWNTGSCSGREVDSWSKLYKPNTKVFYVLSSGVYFYNEGHGGMGKMCFASERDDYWFRLGVRKKISFFFQMPFTDLFETIQQRIITVPILVNVIIVVMQGTELFSKHFFCKLDCFQETRDPLSFYCTNLHTTKRGIIIFLHHAHIQIWNFTLQSN